MQFWGEHKDALERIAAEYQVAPEYIVAILGVETKYGRITGRYRVLDALATLAFDYPPRHAYFTKELEQFLLLAKENKLDPLTLTGSYAGAMGAPQFMPSSYRHYAVDANGDSQRDLWGDWDDVIASVANYLHQAGWRPGAPVLAEATVAADTSFEVDARNLELKETVDALAARGIKTELDVPAETPALLLDAERQDGPAYRVGFHNFYVITRYNTSPRYAMAVHDLAAGGRAGPGRPRCPRLPRPDRRAAPRRERRAHRLGCVLRAAAGRLLARRPSRRQLPGAGARCTARPAGAPAGRRGHRPTPTPSRTRCPGPSRAARTAIRPSTMSSASATSCCPRRRATWSAASPPGTGRPSTAATPPAASSTTCTA